MRHPLAVAALTFDLASRPAGLPEGEMLLLPAGDFRARDGRPEGLPAWRLDAGIAAGVVAASQARATRYVVDYEHQTLAAERNGQPAPAAGWFGAVQWLDGLGLATVGLRWTERARQMLDAGEYRYQSPVFAYDRATGAVREVLHAALTNTPALDGLPEVAARAAARYQLHAAEEALVMTPEQLAALRAALGLPADAAADSVLTAAAALKAQAGAAAAQVAALKAAAPDPAQYAPVAALTALQAEVAALRSAQAGRELDALVTAALSDGRLLPAMEPWARTLGSADLAALKSYLDAAAPIAALRGTQTGGRGPTGDGDADPEAVALKAQAYQDEQAAKGRTITTTEAVAAVRKGAQ